MIFAIVEKHLQTYIQDSPHLFFACLHHKPHTSNFTPNFWAGLYEEDEWLHYPWENDDADTIQDYLK
jgi:hypothetical protein